MRPSFPPRSYSNPYSPRRVAITWRTQYPSCLDWLRPTLLKALQAQREDWWNKTTENLKEIGKTKNHRFLCKEHITFGRVNQCSHNQKSGHVKNLTIWFNVVWKPDLNCQNGIQNIRLLNSVLTTHRLELSMSTVFASFGMKLAQSG